MRKNLNSQILKLILKYKYNLNLIIINSFKDVSESEEEKEMPKNKISSNSPIEKNEKNIENEVFDSLRNEINEKINLCTERETEISQILIELQDIVNKINKLI